MMTELEVTGIIRLARRGQLGAHEHLRSLINDELRRILPGKLLRVGPNEWLRPNEVVSEACANLVRNPGAEPEDRWYFFGVAANLMREILVERSAVYGEVQRRAPRRKNFPLRRVDAPFDTHAPGLPALDEALTELAGVDPRLVKVVELRFFAGLSLQDTAGALQSAEAAVARDWSAASTFLRKKLARPRSV